MNDDFDELVLDEVEEDEELEDGMVSEPKAVLVCPKDGEVSADEVLFWCNTCDRKEMVEKDGVWMCPACLEKVGGMECRKCKSREVRFQE